TTLLWQRKKPRRQRRQSAQQSVQRRQSAQLSAAVHSPFCPTYKKSRSAGFFVSKLFIEGRIKRPCPLCGIFCLSFLKFLFPNNCSPFPYIVLQWATVTENHGIFDHIIW